MYYLKVFFISFGLVVLTVPLVKWFAHRVGAMDKPSAIKIHQKPMPRLGGIAIFLGFSLSLILTHRFETVQYAILAGAGLALLVGIIDDIFSVPATIKLLVLFAITFYVSSRGVKINVFPELQWLGFILTLIWVVGVTSAFNAIDHMDGLAGGLTFIASAAYLYVAIQNNQPQWAAMAVALMGASAGFLIFNFPPSSIFMGDAGSFFLGYTLAIMSVMGAWSTNAFKSILVQVLILGLPIFDLIYVVIRRRMKGITKTMKQIVTFSAKDHFSHRLLDLGMSQRKALFFCYAAMIAFALGAISIRYVEKLEAILLVGQFLMVICLMVILMEIGRGNRSPKS